MWEGVPFSLALNVPHGRACWTVALPLSSVWGWLSSSAELRQPLEDVWTETSTDGECRPLCRCHKKYMKDQFVCHAGNILYIM